MNDMGAPGERLLNWDLKPGAKFWRKPLGRVKGISGRGHIMKARETEAHSRASTSWLGLEVKCEEEGSSRKGWGPEHRSGNKIPCISVKAFRFYPECEEASLNNVEK